LPETATKPDFWSRSANDLLTAVIWFFVQEKPHFCTLPHVISFIQQDEKELIKYVSSNSECRGLLASLEIAMRNQSNNQIAGVVSTLQSALAQLDNPQLFWALSADEAPLDMNDPKRLSWLSIGNNPALSNAYAPAISLIFTVALKMMNQRNKHHSICILDEAPTLYIPGVDRIPATARSNKLAFVYCAQDLAQIEKTYGKGNADVITANLNNQFYGRVSHPRTAEHVSKMFGRDDFEYKSTSNNSSQNTGNSNSEGYSGDSNSRNYGSNSGSSWGKSESISFRERDRVRPQEILSFPVGRFASFLVESNFTDEIIDYYNFYSLAKPLEIKRETPDLKANYNMIKQQIQDLFI